MTNPLIILGAGHAAYSLAREYRRHDAERDITLITRDSGNSYYKPNLSKALAMGKTPEQLMLKTREQQEAALNISVLAQQTVTAIQTSTQTIELADGSTLTYGDLVFATGADSRRFAIDGDANDDILHVNDLDEYSTFTQAIHNAQHVVIMGAGLVGCEFANDLASQNIRSTLVDPAPYPLAALLPPELGAALQAGLDDIEVLQHYSTHVSHIQRSTNHPLGQYEVTLANGESMTADLILSAAGLTVNKQLAELAGLKFNRGIQVDDTLASSQPHIYAIGDCAEINGQLRPYIAPVMPCAKALTQTLLGTTTAVTFAAMPVTVKTPCCPVVACPSQEADSNWLVEGSGQDLTAKQIHQGQVIGFACTGSTVADAKRLQAELSQ